MAKTTKGPGYPGLLLPSNPLASIIKEALKRREEAKMAKTVKGQGVGMSESAKKTSGRIYGGQDYLNEGQFDEMVKKVRAEDKVNISSRAAAIKEGLFTEKNGDLMPTAKYQEYKKSGKLGKFIK